jgi:uncharacterized protein YggT (Ycf19 family)
MTDDKVAADDARQAASQDAAKIRAEKQVNAELSREMSDGSVGTQGRVAEVAAGMRHRAIDESEQGARSIGHARTAARGSQFVDFGFYALYALLGIRLVLAFIGARSGNGFVRFINAITGPFYAPFRGIVDSPSIDGGPTLVIPIIIALLVYALLHAAVNGLLRMVGTRKTTI